ncbi:MAG: hypothetical protein Q4G33_14440 [bacterium]|nr:hypothetical protein [bacterium]
MACFIVPAAEAVVTTAVKKAMEKRTQTSGSGAAAHSFTEKLGWLNKMLWGGSALLLFEHVWHGEVVPFYPFLTAASNPADAAVMLKEMATSGVGMAVLVTAVWAGMTAVTGISAKRNAQKASVRKLKHGGF